MSVSQRAAWLASLALLVSGLPLRADPLRLIPAQADVVFALPRPQQLVETVMGLEAVKQLGQFSALREAYESTNIRRLYQLIDYAEKTLGISRHEMLERLAGEGVAAALKFAPDPAPALLVVEGKDPELTRRFMKLAVDVITDELGRQDKGGPEPTSYRGIDGVRFGDKLYVAAVGSALLVGNKTESVQAAIDLHLDGPGNSLRDDPRLQEGRKLLPAAPLAWLWLDFAKARAQPQFKVVLDTFTTEPAFSLVLGGLPDILQRTPCVAVGLFKETDGFALRLRYPRGRDGMSDRAQIMLPDAVDRVPPLLEPKNMVFTAGQYLDLARIYANRDKLLNKQAQKGLAEIEKKAGNFGIAKLEEILKQSGPHQRAVGTTQYDSTVYKNVPKQYLGAFGFVQEMREPEFGRTMDGVLRAGGLFASFKLPVKRVEEKVGDVTLASYRFADDVEVKEDKDGFRYNFSPCYAQVGNQFMVASTVELGRELIELLQQQAGRTEKQPAGLRAVYQFAALAANLKQNLEPLLSQAVLQQALTPEAARRETDMLIHLVEGLGSARLETNYDSNVTRYDVRLVLGR
jgi:hypothetical protein